MGFSDIVADPDSVCYYRPGGDRSNPFLGLVLDPLHRPNGTRVALRASDRLEVDRLAEIARWAGAAAFEPPHVCDEYTPFYYAAFFEDRRQQARNLLPPKARRDREALISFRARSGGPKFT